MPILQEIKERVLGLRKSRPEIKVGIGQESRYQTIPDPDLRQFLTRVDQEIEQIQIWPSPANQLYMRFSRPFEMNTWDISYMYDRVRANDILKFIAETHGKHTRYFLDQDTLRAFAVLCWTYKKWPHTKQVVNLQERVSWAREALGEHPLVKLLHDPTEKMARDEIQRVIPSELKPREKISPKPVPEVGIEQRKSLARIPAIVEGDAESWDGEKLYQLSRALGNSIEEISFSRGDVPLHIAQIVMFIALANEHRLGKFDPDLEFLNSLQMRNAIRICLAYMKRYPQYDTLGKLFQSIKGVVEKDIPSYYEKSEWLPEGN